MKKIILFKIIFLSFLIPGCTSVEKQEALAAPVGFKDRLIQAQNLSNKNHNQAIVILDELLRNYDENSLSDDALFLMGSILEKQGNTEASIKAFKRILSSKYSSPLDGRTVLKLYQIYMTFGDERRALDALDFVERNALVDQDRLFEIEKLRTPLLLKQERYLSYLDSTSNQIKKSNDQNFKKQLFNKSLSIMKIKMVGPENKRILSRPQLSVFHPQAALNLAEYHFEGEKPQKALEVLETYSNLFTNSYYQNQKIDLIQRAKTFESANTRTIGVLLPLSGRYQEVGQKILQGLQFSLRLWAPQQNNINPIKIVVLDTEAKPEQLDLAFDEMIKKDRPVVFVGGLVGKTAETLVKKSEEYKVPSIVLSQKEGLVENSKYSFQNSQPLSEYTNYISKLAIDTLGLKTASVLHSEKSFSKTYAETFIKSFEKYGGKIVSSIPYNKSERGSIPLAVKTLAQLNTTENRKDEYQKAYNQWKSSSANRRTRDEPTIEELLPPKVEAELLFISDGPKDGGLIASTLAYFDIEDLPLFGPHLWNSDDFIVRGQRFVEDAVFAHSYFEPEILNSKCNSYFKQMYEKPLDVYSYKGLEEGTILNFILNETNVGSRSDMVFSLSKTDVIADFCFPRGLVRMDHNYFSPVAPLTVKNREITIFDPSLYPKFSKENKEIGDKSPEL
jgi:tetratricopeptide (TPR) repeat protein